MGPPIDTREQQAEAAQRILGGGGDVHPQLTHFGLAGGDDAGGIGL